MKLDRKVFFDQVRKSVFRGRRISSTAVETIDALFDEWEKRGLTDTRWLAYMLATVRGECGAKMKPICERGKKSYFNKYEPGTRIGKRLGNTKRGDGYRYRGRGDVQLTGRSNYTRMGKLLGLPLAEKPDLALDPVVAVQILFEGMLRAESFRGDFTGKSLEDYFTATKTDWLNARRIINGTDKAATFARWARQFHTALVAAASASKSPEALDPRRSRTVQGAGGTGTVGTGITVDEGYELGQQTVESIETGQNHISAGTVLGLIIGLGLIGLSAYVLYARWDDAGRPSLREIFSTANMPAVLLRFFGRAA